MITATLLISTTDTGCLTADELRALVDAVGGPAPTAGGSGGTGGTGSLPADTGGGLSLISNSYSTDGTATYFEVTSPTGTTAIRTDIASSSGPYEDGHAVTYAGKLYFASKNPAAGRYGLGVFDGTAVSMVSSDDLNIHGLTIYQNKLYFAALNYTTGTRGLYVFDGTTISSVSTTQGLVRTTETYLTVLGDKLYFIGKDASNGYELWSYDGATAALVSAVVPGTNASGTDTNTAPFSPFTVGSTLYFTGAGTNSDTIYGNWSVYAYTGTGAPTNTGIVVGKNQARYQVFEDKLFVKAGSSLYRFDGATPVEVLDELGGRVSSDYLVADGRMFTARWNGSTNVEILEYAGGVMKKTFDAPTNVGDLRPMGAAGGNLYFSGYDNDYTVGRELWVFDGASVTGLNENPAGDTRLVANFYAYGSNDISDISGTVGDTFYYYATDLASGNDRLFSVTGKTVKPASDFKAGVVFGTYQK
jgi:ELWxxDGT repeat protein